MVPVVRAFLPAVTVALLATLAVAAAPALGASSTVVLHGPAGPKQKLVRAPNSWQPDRTARDGFSLRFYALHWKGWGAARASARGRAVVCDTAGCSSGAVG